MPRVYVKKQGVPPRGTWTEEALSEAVKRYKAGEIGLREAARTYGVPTRTLSRRMAAGNFKKSSLGPQGKLKYCDYLDFTQSLIKDKNSGFIVSTIFFRCVRSRKRKTPSGTHSAFREGRLCSRSTVSS